MSLVVQWARTVTTLSGVWLVCESRLFKWLQSLWKEAVARGITPSTDEVLLKLESLNVNKGS